MPPSELMPIGVFARRSGLTPSALRFYADSGLLRPAETDPVSGYRYYRPDQVARAVALRRLRELAMPLTAVGAVLAAGPEEASRLIDEHLANVLGEAMAARHKAALLKSTLADVPSRPLAALKGPVLADAVEQILTATVREPGLPVLGGLRLEVTPEAVTLTATDRYRLSTRTLVPAEPTTATWAGTVGGEELRAAAAEIRRSPLVRIEATPHAIRLRRAGRRDDQEDPHCGLLTEEFPDYRLMLASLGEATTRVTVSKDVFLRALEDHPGERITLRLTDHGAHVLPPGDNHPGTPLPATVTGRTLSVSFELTTLYPAVSTALGPEVMLDLRGPDRPATIRSADRGDLTTVAMPVKQEDPPRDRHSHDRHSHNPRPDHGGHRPRRHGGPGG
ncbi:MerR family transcriptional regulator [Streptomyces sparsogenes]|uniref:MerR family transcriptional regulator n=1 Tax=Streptomyces sparsogenes DSM 40356 TaxID=1331668 RepID=A0A1R1SSJ4_9ACTN|nr:MerR family transcriptional regulator [Streptomyces sparsogenes]OMI41233.1 MerR family transcriptional regulator [Streptomyces sparsogenes DSM 40356]